MKYAPEIVIVLSLIVASTWIVATVSSVREEPTKTGIPGAYKAVPGTYERDEAQQLAGEIERTAFHLLVIRSFAGVDGAEDLVIDKDSRGLAELLLATTRSRGREWSWEDLGQSVRRLARYEDLSQLSTEQLAGMNEIDREVIEIGEQFAKDSVILWRRTGLLEEQADRSRKDREGRRHVP